MQALAAAFLVGVMTARRRRRNQNPLGRLIMRRLSRAQLYPSLVGAASARLLCGIAVFVAARHLAVRARHARNRDWEACNDPTARP